MRYVGSSRPLWWFLPTPFRGASGAITARIGKKSHHPIIRKPNRYAVIIGEVYTRHYRPGAEARGPARCKLSRDFRHLTRTSSPGKHRRLHLRPPANGLGCGRSGSVTMCRLWSFTKLRALGREAQSHRFRTGGGASALLFSDSSVRNGLP